MICSGMSSAYVMAHLNATTLKKNNEPNIVSSLITFISATTFRSLQKLAQGVGNQSFKAEDEDANCFSSFTPSQSTPILINEARAFGQ